FLGGISNSGVIVSRSGNGISIESAGTFGDNKVGGVTNSGKISAATGTSAGVNIFDVTRFTGGVVNGGTIVGGFAGIRVEEVTSFAGGISNNGRISGFEGLRVSDDQQFSGGIVNAAGGVISAVRGIFVQTVSLSGGIGNKGKIATFQSGIRLNGVIFSGSVSHSGAIVGAGTGIELTFENVFNKFVGDVVNNGTISVSTGVAVRDFSIVSGSIIDSGIIRATNHGILVDDTSEILASKTAIAVKGG